MKKITLLFVLLSCSLFAQEENFTIKNLDVNTEYSDFGTTYISDSVAIYASTKKLYRTIRKRNWRQNDQPFLELYRGVLSPEGEINDSENFSERINTRYHESNVAFTKDLKTVYFTSDNYNEKNKLKRAREGKDENWVLIQLYKATVSDNGEWRDITPMPFNNDNYQTGHPSLNSTEDKLYFTSDMPGGYGITDIYMVAINEDGTYGEPMNLGPQVNTEKREMFPFISNEDVLYFSSDGQENTLGALDIYATKKGSDNFYSAPVNLGTPLNSAKDDFALVYRPGKKSGHFSSNREGGKGDDDIYYFEEIKPIFEEEPCVQVAQGVVKDKKSGNLMPNTQVTLFKDGEKAENITVGEDAAFSFVLDCESTYRVVASKEDYTEDSKEFETSSENSLELDLNLELKPIEEFVELREKIMVNIGPIYFDLDKDFIRPDAAVELDIVVGVMNKYPGIIIEGGSHTDSRASNSYNDRLSARRAQSTVNYIIKKGIDSSRITARGYGENQLSNRCSNGVDCSEKEHQLNRRTEFVIKNPEVINK